jgi:hypothetical protein
MFPQWQLPQISTCAPGRLRRLTNRANRRRAEDA